MKITNIFETATRYRFRYPYKGVINTEDLWDLDVVQLNEIYKTLKAEERKTKEDSLLASTTRSDSILGAKIDIVRRIVEVKLNDAKRATFEKEKAERKQQLMAVLAEKQNEELKSKSTDELRQMIDEMIDNEADR